MSTAAVIVAAGRGTRVGGDVPKQWQPLAGRRVVDRAVDAFRAAPGIGRVVLVLSPADIGRANEFPGIACVAGGSDRAASVRAGLEALAVAAPERVLIHDAARPLVSQHLIATVIAELRGAHAAAPALPVTDALWLGRDGKVVEGRDRRGLYRAQTPQGFRYSDILAAHRASGGGEVDDVAVALGAGIEVAIVPGEEQNLKLTHHQDFFRAAALLEAEMDIRTGNGFDVHRFGSGEQVMLCGIAVPHDRGLTGHSDADVGMHAITDAIYGALAAGDIGQHFPPGEARWKGADSAIFLRHAVDMAAEAGFSISNIDLTLICERPKIGPHAPAMRARLASLMALEPGRVSVKATTSERLGFTGREEGIAANASATLVRR